MKKGLDHPPNLPGGLLLRASFVTVLALLSLAAGPPLAPHPDLPDLGDPEPVALSTCSAPSITSVTLSKVLACSGFCFASGGCSERDAYDAHIIINWSSVAGANLYRARLTPSVPGVFDTWRQVTTSSFYQQDPPFRLSSGSCEPGLNPPGMPIYAGLDQSTSYLVEVQASCDSGSTWSSTASTTTAVSWWLDDGGSCASLGCSGGGF